MENDAHYSLTPPPLSLSLFRLRCPPHPAARVRVRVRVRFVSLECQVVTRSDALEEILDADPAVLENRLSVLLRIEGAVGTPQKLDYIIGALEARAGRSKGLELSVNRMADQ